MSSVTFVYCHSIRSVPCSIAVAARQFEDLHQQYITLINKEYIPIALIAAPFKGRCQQMRPKGPLQITTPIAV